MASRGLAGAARHGGPQRQKIPLSEDIGVQTDVPDVTRQRHVYARVINGHKHFEGVYGSASVLVVVLAVSRVPAPVVHIVDMITVRDRDVATPLTMDMVMMFMHQVA